MFKPHDPGERVRRLFEIQQGRCIVCGGHLPNVTRKLNGEPFSISLEHIMPRALGGADNDRNIALSHRRCNTEKADRPPTGCELIWRETIRAHIGQSDFDIPADTNETPTAFAAAFENAGVTI